MIRRPRKSERLLSGNYCEQGSNLTYPTDLCFVLRVPGNLPKLLLSMSKLALASVPATSFLFPAAAEFRFVETQLPIVRTWTIAIRSGVLGNSGGRGSQPTVIRGGANKRSRVLVLEVPSHQLRGSEIILCIILRWVELVGIHRESGSAERGLRIHSSRELLLEVQELLLYLTERRGIRGGMLVGRTEGLSLDAGNSRIRWDDHIVKLLRGSGGEGLYRVCEVSLIGWDILELLVERPSDLRLTEWHIVHALIEGVPRELSMRCIIIDLEVLLVATGERREGGLIAMRPILVVKRLVSSIRCDCFKCRYKPGQWSRESPCHLIRR